MDFSGNKNIWFKSQYILSLFFILGCFSLPYLVLNSNNALAELPNVTNVPLKTQPIETQKGASDKKIDIFDPNYNGNTEDDGVVGPSANPIKVDCGVYIKSFGNFDYRKNTFFTNFYIWWLMDEGAKYSPEDTMEITNGQQWVRLWVARDKIKNKTRVQARFYGTINHVWNMKYFPFDRQKIRISIEDNIAELSQVRFNPLSKDSEMSPDIMMQGWKLRFGLVHEPHLNSTNFGDLDRTVSVTSRLNVIFDMKREGWQIFFVYFIGYFVAIFLSFITYLIPRRYFNESTTLCLGAIFAAIGNKSQLEFSLSGTEGLSFSGIFTLCTFTIIMVTIINTILSHSLYVDEKRSLSAWVNYSILFSIVLLLSIVMGTALQEAINS